jgi:hypothetical protein
MSLKVGKFTGLSWVVLFLVEAATTQIFVLSSLSVGIGYFELEQEKYSALIFQYFTLEYFIWSYSQSSCTTQFYSHCDQIPDRNNLTKERFI